MIEKNLIMDKRIIKRNIERGRLTQAQYDAHVKALPNVESHASTQHVEVRSGEFELVVPETVEE
ncbi:MAG: hypothetical protein FJ109_08435 [Deltaproteobacteria bacterium]|nr:hypothetical protein [Deltaproteobacteria bacterium]